MVHCLLVAFMLIELSDFFLLVSVQKIRINLTSVHRLKLKENSLCQFDLFDLKIV